MLHNIVKSFQSIFYVSKYFGCNLYPIPKVLSAANVKMNLRATDVLIYLVHIGLALGVSIPLIRKWEDQSSPLRKELESQISLSSVVMLSITGAAVNYAHVIIFLFIIMFDMINAPVIRGFLLLFNDIDEKVYHLWFRTDR